MTDNTTDLVPSTGWQRPVAYRLSPVSLYPAPPPFGRIGRALAYNTDFQGAVPAPSANSNTLQASQSIPDWALALGAIAIIWWFGKRS